MLGNRRNGGDFATELTGHREHDCLMRNSLGNLTERLEQLRFVFDGDSNVVKIVTTIAPKLNKFHRTNDLGV
jgi:hypothetical protein